MKACGFILNLMADLPGRAATVNCPFRAADLWRVPCSSARDEGESVAER
jgi:hypothetical protein